jgi:hypothetical protein
MKERHIAHRALVQRTFAVITKKHFSELRWCRNSITKISAISSAETQKINKTTSVQQSAASYCWLKNESVARSKTLQTFCVLETIIGEVKRVREYFQTRETKKNMSLL